MSFYQSPFYKLPLWVQWLAACTLLLGLLVCCLGMVVLMNQNLLWALLTPLLIPLSQFAISPFFTLIGVYRYLSPMLLVYLPTRESLELHHASSFDYLFLSRHETACVSRKKQHLMFYLDGLLRLIALMEAGQVSPNVHIEATTYFVNERTTRRLGLRLYKPTRIKRLCMCLNFFDLLWMYSYTCRKFQLPSFNQLAFLRGRGYQLLQHKPRLQRLSQRLKHQPQTQTTAVQEPNLSVGKEEKISEIGFKPQALL